jgi:two-component system response regulator (stage 0 sporulation protein F)
MNEKPKILYVDDEIVNLELFVRMFQRKYEVATGLSGAEGLEMLAADPNIQLVISDMRMPGLTGLEFIRRAKAHHPQLPFFILTGFAITREIEEALENGTVRSYFQKPFNRDDLDAAIAESLS